MKKFWKSLMFAALGVFALSSCEDVPAPYDIPGAGSENTPTEVVEPEGDGTLASPYNVARLQELINADNAPTGEIYIKGKISQIRSLDTSKYNRAQYYISDDGTTKNQFYVYNGLYLDGANFTSDDQIKVGDEVVIIGTLTTYNGAYQVNQNSKIVSLNGQGGEPGETATPVGSGTKDDPYNVAKVKALISEGNVPTGEIYIKGIISQIRSLDTSKYNRAQYYISDDGKTSNQFYVYNGLYLGGENFTSDDQIKVGDEIVILGTLGTYQGEYQVAQNSKIVSLNGQGGEPGETATPVGSGTKDDPYNVAKVKALIGEGNVPTGEIYIKGIISQIRSLDTSKYTRAQYYISDDGKNSNQFYVYNGLYLGGENFTSDDQIKVGDKVVILGTLGSYQGEYQVAQNSKIVEINGKKADDTPTPDPTGTPEGDGTMANPWNVAAVTKAYAENNSFYDASKEYYVKGIVTNVATFNSTYGSLSYYIADEANGTNTFYVYSGLGLEQSKFSSKNDLKTGDEVVVCGKFTVYNGTFEFQYNNYLVSLNGATDPGDLPDNPGGSGVEGNSITFSTMGYENSQSLDGQPITLGDATLTFSKASGGTAPAYYNTGSAMRMYGSNTLTIASSKTISKVEFKFADGKDSNDRPYYPTTDNASVTPGNYDFATQTWTGSANEIVLTYTAKGGHFRIIGLTITYAE